LLSECNLHRYSTVRYLLQPLPGRYPYTERFFFPAVRNLVVVGLYKSWILSQAALEPRTLALLNAVHFTHSSKAPGFNP
jgi:hypothetical protein